MLLRYYVIFINMLLKYKLLLQNTRTWNLIIIKIRNCRNWRNKCHIHLRDTNPTSLISLNFWIYYNYSTCINLYEHYYREYGTKNNNNIYRVLFCITLPFTYFCYHLWCFDWRLILFYKIYRWNLEEKKFGTACIRLSNLLINKLKRFSTILIL